MQDDKLAGQAIHYPNRLFILKIKPEGQLVSFILPLHIISLSQIKSLQFIHLLAYFLSWSNFGEKDVLFGMSGS